MIFNVLVAHFDSIHTHNSFLWVCINTHKFDFWVSLDNHKTMKTNRKSLSNQQSLMEKRIAGWAQVRQSETPPTGWIKAVRGALGISTRQLAALLGTDHSAIVALEKREAKGTASLEMIQRTAKAMGCKLVYAIVPEAPSTTLDDIVDARARDLASRLLVRVEHSMRLEKQGSDPTDSKAKIGKLSFELKTKMDSRIWDATTPKKKKAQR
jgi:predicted DNA-binding mobile mystery protein A